MNKPMNGKILWGHRFNQQRVALSHADETRWMVPFVLTPEATAALAALSPAAAHSRLTNWFHGTLVKRNTTHVSWGVAAVEYVHGLPGGHLVVYSAINIGD